MLPITVRPLGVDMLPAAIQKKNLLKKNLKNRQRQLLPLQKQESDFHCTATTDCTTAIE